MESIKLLKDVYVNNLMSRWHVFDWHKRFGEVREKVEMINILITLRLRKPYKKFRKSVKLFAKIDV